jgi:hypothetical protein
MQRWLDEPLVANIKSLAVQLMQVSERLADVYLTVTWWS